MKIYQKKNALLSLTLLAAVVFVFARTAAAQQLKPTKIVYSRLQPNLQAAPTGANQPTIWAVGQDGANDRQITTGTHPRISDDGRFLLFKRFPGTPNNPFGNPWAGDGQLWVRDIANNTETMIFSWGFSGYILGYYFSPESNRGNYQIILSYVTLTYKVNLDGTGGTPIPGQFERDYFPVVRRGDGQIVSHAQDNTGLVTLTFDTAMRTIIPNTLPGDYNPSWSNDNQFIGYSSVVPTNANPFSYNAPYPYVFSKLNKIKPDGTGKTVLVDLSANQTNGIAFGTIWTESNSKIIVAARINGIAGLYAVNADGSGTYTQIPISDGNPPDFVGGIVQPREEQQVASTGGGVSASGNYTLIDTIGEVAAGETSTGGQYSLQSGFWAAFAAPHKTLFDFDGDGKADVSVFRPDNGVWYLLQSQAGFAGVQFGVASDKLAPADFDGDGRADIAVYRGGTWYLQRSSLGFTGIAFGASGDVPAPADFDGDGKADLAVWRPSNGVWYVYNLANNQFVAVQFGASGDKPTVADYDGDGKADYAVFRPSNGAWYVQRSNLGFTGFLFGASTDVPVQADYDGDGKTDFAVFRPENGVWYLHQSTAGFTGIAFGFGTDAPVPADYDGDGKTDVAVFRSGTWYLNRSQAGFLGIAFGASDDKPVPNAFVP